MEILYTITSYLPAIGGAQIHTHELVKRLSKGNTINIACLWDSNRTDWLLGTTLFAHSKTYDYSFDEVNVHRIGLSKEEKYSIAPFVGFYYLFMGISLSVIAKVFEQHLEAYVSKVDIIHNVRIGREPFSFASYSLAKKNDIPFVLTPLHHPRWSGWLHRYYLDLYRKADAVIALTESEKLTLIDLGVDESRIHVTGIGPVLADSWDAKGFRNKFSLGKDPFILFLGQKYAYKGVEVLLQASFQVWKKFPEVRFIFIGPRTNYSSKLFTTITDSRILELDKVNLQTKTDALAACTILCVPSSQESFGGVYTEAWSFEKPVIGLNIPAVSEVIDHGVNGLLVNRQPEEVADAILEILSDQKLAQSMGAAGLQKVKDRYSWDQLAVKTNQIYQCVLGK
jgi:glycosyltransferase involved in cell wall biosynthesis